MIKLRGFSLLGMLFMLACLVGIGYLILNLAPAYWDNYIVKSKLNDLKTGADLTPDMRRALQNKMAIGGFLASRLKIEGIYDIPVDDIEVKRVDSGLEVSLTYEVRKPMVANVDVVLTFSDSVIVPSDEQISE